MNHHEAGRVEAGALHGRAILVTGASGALGRTIALGAARHGATVVLHGRDEKRLIAVYDEITALGAPEPAAIPLDFSGATSRHFDALAADIAGHVGRLDGIVHCATRSDRLAPMAASAVEDWSALFQVNVTAALGLTRACLPMLRAALDASVVFTLEAHHGSATSFWGPYSVPGAALATAMRIHASEGTTFPHLRFNAVVPGPIAAPTRRITHPAETKGTLPPPDSVVPVYLWLLSEAAKGTTGEIFAPPRDTAG